MSVYENACGKFWLEVGDPHPMWVQMDIEGMKAPGRITSADLYDLKHLVDRAIAAVEAEERKIERRRG